MTDENLIYKNKNEVITISAESQSEVRTEVVFFSHDKGTAKLTFKLMKNDVAFPLSNSAQVLICLLFNNENADGGVGRHIYIADIEDDVNGIVSIVLKDNILGYVGVVHGSVYVDYETKQSLDTAGRFNFSIARSPIDDEIPEMDDYYYEGFNKINEKFIQINSDIEKFKRELSEKQAEVEKELAALSQQIKDEDIVKREELEPLKDETNAVYLSINSQISANSKGYDFDEPPVRGYKKGDIWHFKKGEVSTVANNMLRNSGLSSGISFWRDWGAGVGTKTRVAIEGLTNIRYGFEISRTVSTGELGYAQDNITVLPNTEYTISFWAKSKTGRAKVSIQKGAVTNFVNTIKEVGTSWERVEYSWRTDNDTTKTNYYLGFNVPNIGSVVIAGMKFEQGKTVGQWTPHVDDVLDSNEGYLIATKDNDHLDFNDWEKYTGKLRNTADSVKAELDKHIKDTENTGGTDETKVIQLIEENADNVIAKDTSMKYISHRGNFSSYPENSMGAFATVGSHWGTESDIQVTKDGHWIMMHDASVSRTTNGTGNVKDLTLAQIRAFKMKFKDTWEDGRWPTGYDKVPTLQEYLSICKTRGKVPVIEIKFTGYTQKNYDDLAEIVKQYHVQNEVVFIAFEFETLVEIRKRLPHVYVMWLTDDLTKPFMDRVKNQFKYNCGIDVYHVGANVNAENVKYAHELNMKVGFWTVPYASQKRLVEMGADFITTNEKGGVLRIGQVALENGFKNQDLDRVEGNTLTELENGDVRLELIVYEGSSDRNKLIGKLPEWAIPVKSSWGKCKIRTSTSTEQQEATVDIVGWQDKAGVGKLPGHVVVGLGWSGRTTWAKINTTYKLF